ncbi:MAG: ligase-associated DNA damage response exonuclease [Bacteroidia bacterium]
MAKGLIEFTPKGMYVPQADVYIDPCTAVDKAFLTHAHSDHARPGSSVYFAHAQSVPILKHRLGNPPMQAYQYGEKLMVNGVQFSFHPSGHVPGSAQIRVEYKGEVWVAAGDYKLENDGLSIPFEPVPCHTFITESTFGLPIYQWKNQALVFNEIDEWWKSNQERNICSVVFAYSLGKAQRILQNVNHDIGEILVHGSIANMNEACEKAGFKLKPWKLLNAEISKEQIRKALVIAPPAAGGTTWLNKLEPYSDAVASGWMAVRGSRRRLSADRGFVLSDHADWDGLNEAVKQSGAEKIIVSHGFTAAYARWLNECGYQAIEEGLQFAEE